MTDAAVAAGIAATPDDSPSGLTLAALLGVLTRANARRTALGLPPVVLEVPDVGGRPWRTT